MNVEDNGNGVGLLKPMSSSNEDLSEYTDADESISAPTEILAEFLSAVMLKDYSTALKYCKLILQYEPNNVTAKEFYPLILEKLQQIDNIEQEEQGHDEEEAQDDEEDESCSSSSSSSVSEISSSEETSDEDDEEEADEEIEVEAGDKQSKGSSDGGDATTGSYSSLEEDESELDQLAALATKHQIDNLNLGNGNKLYTPEKKSEKMKKWTYANEGSLPFGSSDSESPTEPITLQTIAMLRAKVVPQK